MLSELPCSFLSRASPPEDKEHGLGVKAGIFQADSSAALSRWAWRVLDLGTSSEPLFPENGLDNFPRPPPSPAFCGDIRK